MGFAVMLLTLDGRASKAKDWVDAETDVGIEDGVEDDVAGDAEIACVTVLELVLDTGAKSAISGELPYNCDIFSCMACQLSGEIVMYRVFTRSFGKTIV